MGPSINRLVQYEDTNGVVKPAIITKVWPNSSDNLVNLYVFPVDHNDTLQGVYTSVAQGEAGDTSTQHLKWFWPPLVPKD